MPTTLELQQLGGELDEVGLFFRDVVQCYVREARLFERIELLSPHVEIGAALGPLDHLRSSSAVAGVCCRRLDRTVSHHQGLSLR